jgi:hypothetical protein
MALRRQSYLRGLLLKGHIADLSFCGSSEYKFALNPIHGNSSCIFTIIMIYSAQILRFIKYLTMQDGCLVVMVEHNQGTPNREGERAGFQFDRLFDLKTLSRFLITFLVHYHFSQLNRPVSLFFIRIKIQNLPEGEMTSK